MKYRDWLSLLIAITGGAAGLTLGAVSVELLRLVLDKSRRQEQIQRIRVFGLKSVLRKALMGDPRLELNLRQPQRRSA